MLENPSSDDFLECLKEEGKNTSLQIFLIYFSGFTRGQGKDVKFIFSDGKMLNPKACIKDTFNHYKKIQLMQILDYYNLFRKSNEEAKSTFTF